MPFPRRPRFTSDENPYAGDPEMVRQALLDRLRLGTGGETVPPDVTEPEPRIGVRPIDPTRMPDAEDDPRFSPRPPEPPIRLATPPNVGAVPRGGAVFTNLTGRPDAPLPAAGQGDVPPPMPSPTPPPGTASRATPTAAYLKSLIDGGLSPQAAIAQFNQETGRTTGNEAVYYGPEVHGRATIGLPEAYLSNEPGGWAVTQRSPENPRAVTGSTAGQEPPPPSSGRLTEAQAIDYLQQRLGRVISPTELASIKQRFGYDPAGTYTMAGLQPILEALSGGGRGPQPLDLDVGGQRTGRIDLGGPPPGQPGNLDWFTKLLMDLRLGGQGGR